MGLFAKSQVRPGGTDARVLPMGPGLRFRSSAGVSRCLEVLGEVLTGYREPPYAHMPSWVSPGWVWDGAPGSRPTVAAAFRDRENDFVFALFWHAGPGAVIGFFPLSAGDLVRSLPIAGDWRARDASLTADGAFAAGLFALAPPEVPPDFFEDLLAAAGFPATTGNVEKVAVQVGAMLVTKARQYIAGRDPRGADRFAQAHQAGRFFARIPALPARQYPAWVLSDLAGWDRAILPVMQDLPMRCRAIMLDVLGEPGTFWEMLEQ